MFDPEIKPKQKDIGILVKSLERTHVHVPPKAATFVLVIHSDQTWHTSGAPNENMVQNHLNIALFNVF